MTDVKTIQLYSTLFTSYGTEGCILAIERGEEIHFDSKKLFVKKELKIF